MEANDNELTIRIEKRWQNPPVTETNFFVQEIKYSHCSASVKGIHNVQHIPVAERKGLLKFHTLQPCPRTGVLQNLASNFGLKVTDFQILYRGALK